MIRHLRGAWARRRVLLPLVLLTATVVAGVVTVVGFAGAAGTSGALALPLLVLGAVAVPATARELATVRRGEIALARLRGMESGELQALLLVEPALALVLGGALGVGAGTGGAWLAGRAWIDTDADPLGLDALLAGLAVVVVALVAAAIGSAAVQREPLVQQVSPAERPRRGSVAATFGRVLVVVAAIVAVYRARTATGTDPDWVVLAGPALVGLAAGQVVVGGVQLLARLAVRRPAGGLPVFLAARRVARLPDAARALHVVVGAAVVAGLALTGALQVDGWVDDTTRLQLGAPVQVPVEGASALEVLSTTHRIDPDGRWLMAAVLVPSPGGPQARRAFLDTARYDRVVGPFLDGTAASGLADHVSELASDAPQLATGDRVAVTVAGVSARRSGRLLPVVDIGYRDGSGAETRVRVRAEIATDGRPVSASAPLPGCEGGCELTDVLLRRGTDSSPLPWLLTGLDLGGVDALALGWVADRPSIDVDSGLLAPAGTVARARSVGSLGATPVLTTPSVAPGDRGTIASTGGDERETRVLDVLDALPLVGSDGMLADLPTAAAGAPPTVPAAEALVLARADTPDDVLAALSEAGGGEPTTLADAEEATAEATGAAQARVYALMAGCCLLVALLVLVTAVARQRDGWRHEVAALRATGVDPATARGAGRVEVLVLALAAGVAAAAGAVLAVRLLLEELALVTVPPNTLPLQTGLAALPLAAVAGVVVLGVLLVVGRGRRVGPGSRPALLREGAAR